MKTRLVWMFASLLAAMAGCTLVTDPSRHQGGTTTDAGRDAAQFDAGPDHDAGPEGDAAMDDAAVVAEDAGPMECTTDAECPSGSTHCVEGRCTVCLPEDPSFLDVHADPGLQDDLDLVLAEDGTTREAVLSWRGSGTRIYLHRTPIDAPASPGSFTSATDAITTLAFLDGVSSVDDVAIGADQYVGSSNGRIDLVVVGHLGAAQTFFGAVIYSNESSAITSSTYPDPERFNAPNQVFGRGAIVGGVVALRSVVAGMQTVETLDVAYLNTQESTTSGVPAGDPGTMEIAADQLLMTDPANTAQAYVWSPGDFGVGTLATPDRTGDPAAAAMGTSSFAMIYPAGSELYLRQVNCIGTCMTSASVRADIRTGADEVAWARIGTLVNGTALVVLSAERTGTTWRVVLRAFRPDFSPLTMPGRQSRLVLDEATMPDTLPVGRLAVSAPTGGAHVVASWLDHAATGNRTLRLASMPVTCD